MEDQYFGYFPAKYATNYIKSYVDNHTYKDKTIRDRIMFNIRVQQVEPVEDGCGRWLVTFLWKGTDQHIRTLANYKRPEGLQNGFAALEPDTP